MGWKNKFINLEQPKAANYHLNQLTISQFH